MATFAIGDVQGCATTLQRLVKRIGFDSRQDRLWFVGDLVNRGPDNVGVLRFIRDLGSRAEVVLGNHDLHLLARAEGLSPAKDLDTIEDVLKAKDRDELVEWVAKQPLMIRQGDWLMVHAGLLPSWTVHQAEGEARRVEQLLRNPKQRGKILGKQGFDPALKAMTTIRTVMDDDTLCKYSGAPAAAPPGCRPWFSHPARQSRGARVIFGHWSALGYQSGPDYLALDSGCVWGNELTAVRLDDGKKFSEPCADKLP